MPAIARRVSHLVGPDLLFLSGFAALTLVLSRVYGTPLRFIHGSTWLPTLSAVALVAVALWRRQSTLATVRDWFPLILVIVVYDNFHDLTRVVHERTVDATLLNLDERLFGVEPSLWLQRATCPWLTELMSLAYALLFVFPTVILLGLHRRGDRRRFRELGFALVLAYCMGLVGFMTVPAVGPRYALASSFVVPLDGYWLTEPARQAWNSLEAVDRDCFPSLHTALSSIALIYFWRLRRAWPLARLLFWVSLPLIVCLWVSTLYLRYHYAVDVLAGFAVAASSAWCAPRVCRLWHGERASVIAIMAASSGSRQPS
jgi:membrane-associated phospholipid phosphatase